MSIESQNPSLIEGATRFLAGLPPEEREVSQQEIYRFIRWYGRERTFNGLTAPEVANYAERLSSSDTDYTRKLDLIRAFLAYAKKQGWSKISLATHLKARKEKPRAQPVPKRNLPEAISLTQQGYTELEAELEELKEKRLQVIDEVRRAAADKDFRENAPLDAAREQRSLIEGRIRELEEALKAGTVVNRQREDNLRANVGDSIILCDLTSGEEVCYTLVSPKEVDPSKGKVSIVSPIGKAILGQSEGEEIEMVVPVGKLRYQIKRIEQP